MRCAFIAKLGIHFRDRMEGIKEAIRRPFCAAWENSSRQRGLKKATPQNIGIPQKHYLCLPQALSTFYIMDTWHRLSLSDLLATSAWIAAHITLIVVVVKAVALLVPSSFVGMDTSVITPMLGMVMFGMGLTLRPCHLACDHPFCPVSHGRCTRCAIFRVAQFLRKHRSPSFSGTQQIASMPRNNNQ